MVRPCSPSSFFSSSLAELCTSLSSSSFFSSSSLLSEFCPSLLLSSLLSELCTSLSSSSFSLVLEFCLSPLLPPRFLLCLALIIASPSLYNPLRFFPMLFYVSALALYQRCICRVSTNV